MKARELFKNLKEMMKDEEEALIICQTRIELLGSIIELIDLSNYVQKSNEERKEN